MGFAHLTGRLDMSQERRDEQVYRLTVPCEPALGCLLHLISSRPFRVGRTRLVVHITPRVPEGGRFHVRRVQASKEGRRKGVTSLHADRFHARRVPGMKVVYTQVTAEIPTTQEPLISCGSHRLAGSF